MSTPLLRAFRHPCILLSIAVLLLNDHLFKTLAPSWATGKISDFAGLFFFPFLMGVLLQAWNLKRVPFTFTFIPSNSRLKTQNDVSLRTIPHTIRLPFSSLHNKRYRPKETNNEQSSSLSIQNYLLDHYYYITFVRL